MDFKASLIMITDSFILFQATKWCDDGIYLLASQPVDKCQSQDGAESALQEIERYLETANQHKLTDLNGIWRDYESVLTQDLRVKDWKSLTELTELTCRAVIRVAYRFLITYTYLLRVIGYLKCYWECEYVLWGISLLDKCFLFAQTGSGGQSVSEAAVHAGNVWKEEGQSEEVSSQTDTTRAARCSTSWGHHQITHLFPRFTPKSDFLCVVLDV